MHHPFMQTMADALAEHGIATLRYQFTYMEAGRKRPDPQSLLLATVRAAVATARKEARALPLIAGGKSMGGRMTSLAASNEALPNVCGLAFLGFPLHQAGKPSDDRAEHLAAVELPMLFVQGTRDKLADLEWLEPVVDELEGASLHIVDQGDHSLALPKRAGRPPDIVLDEVATVIAGWVDGVVG